MSADTMMTKRVEARDLCAKCGGYCCLNVPGKFIPDDLAPGGRLDEQIVGEALDSGLAVIYTSFASADGCRLAPIFTLATRGVDRPPLSLCHEATRCVHLKGDRCRYPLEKRPYECAVMVPAENISQCGMPNDELIEPYWVEYQELLRGIIERRSGRSWYRELMSQAEERRHTDNYAYGAYSIIQALGLALSSEEADAIIAKWMESLE